MKWLLVVTRRNARPRSRSDSRGFRRGRSAGLSCCPLSSAHAITTIADESGAPLAFIGDRAQLPAVGRGGVLDMAVGASPRPLDMTELHRFREEGYAQLTLRMRDRSTSIRAVPRCMRWNALARRGRR